MGQKTKQIRGKIIFKHQTAAEWDLSNNGAGAQYIPDIGEKVLYDPDETCKYTREKYGDGIHIVKDLPFSGSGDASIIENLSLKSDAWINVEDGTYFQAFNIESVKDGDLLEVMISFDQTSMLIGTVEHISAINAEGTPVIQLVGSKPQIDIDAQLIIRGAVHQNTATPFKYV